MKPARIVLIEDNPADVVLVELALKEHGILYELTRFSTGREAVAFLCSAESENSFVPDAILLDLNTPLSDGFQVLSRLQHSPRFASVPLAVITSSEASHDRSRTALLNVRYILKPSHLDDFLSTVGSAVKQMLER